jgi:WXG100 family type VII secretion target
MPSSHLPAEDLRQLASELGRAGRVNNEALAGLERRLAALEKKWKGAAQEAFYRQFQDLRPHMARLSAHLQLVAEQVEALVQRYESVDRS